jgi:hypothetical protein
LVGGLLTVQVTATDYRFHWLAARAGGLETTRWVTFCDLPFLPLARWRARYAGMATPMPKEDESFVFEPLQRLPLGAGGVFRTAGCGWCSVALAVGPVLGCLFGVQGPASPFEMALVFASWCWPLLILIAVQRRWRAIVQPPPGEVRRAERWWNAPSAG